MTDVVGVPSIERAQFTGEVRPDRLSQLIDPAIQVALKALTEGAAQDYVFSVYNKLDGEYMLFVPNNDDPAVTTETVGFVFKYIPSLKIQSWSRYTGWNWSCGCSSLLGRIFYMKGTKLYVQGSNDDKVYADYLGDPDIDEPTLGKPINWVWELPWSDLKERNRTKNTRYIRFDTTGTAQFLCTMFVNNKYQNKSTGELTPMLSMGFTGGDSAGYGGGDQPFGGGRRTSDERLYAWPAKFNIFKLRFEGAARSDLRFTSIGLYYSQGGIRQ